MMIKDNAPAGLSRRQFGLMAGAAMLVTACAGRGAVSAASGTLGNRVGIQLYTIRGTFERDPLAALQAVAAAGYSEVEFGGGGFYERDPAELKGFLQETGLNGASMHVGLADLEASVDRAISFATTLGVDHVVLPAVPPARRTSIEDWKQVARICDEAAKRFADAGLAFAYHNHAFEFEALSGDTNGYDIFTGETSSDLVKLELDFFWALTAKQDPLALIDRFAGRISLCHVKDMDAEGNMCLPGEGIVDFAAYFGQAEKAGLKHFFVEFDRLVEADVPRMRASADHVRAIPVS